MDRIARLRQRISTLERGRDIERPQIAIGRLEKKGREWYVTDHTHRKPQYPRTSFRSLVENLYRKNELVYAGIQRLMKSFSQGMPAITDGERVDTTGPGVKLRRRPSPDMTFVEFIQWCILYRVAGGNCFIEKIRGGTNGRGNVVELWPHGPDVVRIVPSKTEYIAGYIVSVGSKDHFVDRDDMIHWKNPDPLDRWFGMPDLLPALRRTALDNDLTDMAKSMAENFAIPPVVIKTNMARADDALLDRLKLLWEKAFGGKNRGKPAFLGKDMEVQTIAMNFEELTFPEITSEDEARILMVLGVSPILVGAKVGLDRATYTNYLEARVSFYQDTVQPLQGELAALFTYGLMDEFKNPDKWRVFFDVQNVPAMKQLEEERRAKVMDELRAGLITREEARYRLGEETILVEEHEAGIFYIPVNISMVDALTGETINQPGLLGTQDGEEEEEEDDDEGDDDDAGDDDTKPPVTDDDDS